MGNIQDEKMGQADEKILAKIAQQLGLIPKPIKVMAERPGIVESFMTYRNQIFEGGPLSDKERALVAMAAAVVLRSAPCIHNHANHARNAGAQEAEIVQTALIANLMSGVSPLHAAYAGIKEQ